MDEVSLTIRGFAADPHAVAATLTRAPSRLGVVGKPVKPVT
jgi:hypothetical protein